MQMMQLLHRVDRHFSNADTNASRDELHLFRLLVGPTFRHVVRESIFQLIATLFHLTKPPARQQRE